MICLTSKNLGGHKSLLLKNTSLKIEALQPITFSYAIKGNNYRLIVRINNNYQMLWIHFIGTHAQYDKIDATKI